MYRTIKKRNNRTGRERKESVTMMRARIFSTSSDTIFFPTRRLSNNPFYAPLLAVFVSHHTIHFSKVRG